MILVKEEDPCKKIIKIIKDHGINLEGYDPELILKAITKRQNIQNIEFDKYIDVLNHNDTEILELIDQILIFVSEFFRDTSTYSALENIVIPQLLSKNHKNSTKRLLRIWSAACSSGEEAYSIAVLLEDVKENFFPNLDYQIFASDVIESQLDDAQRGIYPPQKLNNIRFGHLNKYFDQVGKSYSVKGSLKNKIQFSKHNLLNGKTSFPSHSIFGNFEIVFCCNVLIYYNQSSQIKMLNKICNSIATEGYLVLGENEVLPDVFKNNFEQLNLNCKIYQKKGK